MSLKLPLLLMGAFILIYSPIFAQKLTGTVKSAGKPIQSGTVQALPFGNGTTTDGDGKYSLTLKAGSYQVTVSAIGFEKKIMSVQLADGESKVLDVELIPSSESLKEVIVVGSRGGGRTKIESPVPVDVINVNSVGIYLHLLMKWVRAAVVTVVRI